MEQKLLLVLHEIGFDEFQINHVKQFLQNREVDYER